MYFGMDQKAGEKKNSYHLEGKIIAHSQDLERISQTVHRRLLVPWDVMKCSTVKYLKNNLYISPSRKLNAQSSRRLTKQSFVKTSVFQTFLGPQNLHFP